MVCLLYTVSFEVSALQNGGAVIIMFDSCSGHNLCSISVFVTIDIVVLICAKCMFSNCTAPVCCVC